jgi:hypothetical protein
MFHTWSPTTDIRKRSWGSLGENRAVRARAILFSGLTLLYLGFTRC